MTVVPADTPRTRPAPAIVAPVGTVLLHVPPVYESDSVTERPTQTLDGPVIPEGSESIVTT